MKDWLQTGAHNIFRNMLQVERTSSIGWLCYSTREMDAGALADEIEDQIGIKIGLRWKVIPTGNTKSKMPDKEKINALEVEVDRNERDFAQRKLLRFYCRSSKDTKEYPNGIRLRFVKPYAEAVSTNEKSKINLLRNRQAEFLNGIVSRSTWDVVQLDYHKDNEPTLRQMIMSIKTKDNNKIPLFHCVDLDWKRDGFTFQYAPDLQDEAECVIFTLLPHLKFLFPHVSSLESHFTESCIDRCEGLIYDETTGEVVDSDFNGDKTSDGEIVFVDDENLLGCKFGNKNKDAENEINNISCERTDNEAKASRFKNPNRDDDSVSTLGGTMKTKVSSRFAPRYSNPTPDDRSAETISTVTMETVVSLESKFSKLVEESNKMFDAKFDYLARLLEKSNTSTNSSKDDLSGRDTTAPGASADNNISGNRS